MFKPIEEIKTTKLMADHHGFIVDIEETNTMFTAWLYHERYQVKFFLDKEYKSNMSFKQFMDNIEKLVDHFVWEYLDYYQGDKMGYDYDEDKFVEIITSTSYYNHTLEGDGN